MNNKEEIARLQKIVDGLVDGMCWVLNRVEENPDLMADYVLIPMNNAKSELEEMIEHYRYQDRERE